MTDRAREETNRIPAQSTANIVVCSGEPERSKHLPNHYIPASTRIQSRSCTWETFIILIGGCP